MILPIYIYGQPVLRKVAEDVTPEYPELKTLIANMLGCFSRNKCESFPSITGKNAQGSR